MKPWFKITKVSPWYEVYEMKIYGGKKFYPHFVVIANGDKISGVKVKGFPKPRNVEELRAFVDIADDVLSWAENVDLLKTFESLSDLRQYLLGQNAFATMNDGWLTFTERF